MARRRSATEALPQLAFRDFENFEDDFLNIVGSDAGRGGFHGDGAVAERLGVETH